MTTQITLRRRSEDARRAYAEGFMAGVRYVLDAVIRAGGQAEVTAELMRRVDETDKEETAS